MTALPTIQEMVEYYLPVLVTAGDYAHRIQPTVARPAQKSGHNAWVQVVTDADQLVQAYVEVATLARFPDVAFFGEEHEQSRNSRYFPPESHTKVWLDPVNGTFLYASQQTGWDIILSISRQNRLMAAISYMPARGTFYLAIRGQGAFTGDRSATTLAHLAPLSTRAGSNVCLTYQAPSEKALLRRHFDSFDIVDDHDPRRGYDNLNDLFTGRLDGFLCKPGDLLDWGAAAFIVANAGGVVTTVTGQPTDMFENFTLRSTDMLVATTPAVHQRLIAALRSPG